MLNLKYFEDVIKDEFGYPRDFKSKSEITAYLRRFRNADLQTDKLTIIDVGTFEFELPPNIHNLCGYGYLRTVYTVARKVKRYRQLQEKFDWLWRCGGGNDDGKYDENMKILLTPDYHGVPYSFLWAIHRKGEDRIPYHGGLIMHAPEGFYKNNKGEVTFDFNIPWGEHHGWGLHE